MGFHDISMDKAELLAVLLEAILYGFSLLMFMATIWTLVSQRSTEQVNRKILAAACGLLLFSTAHLVIDIIRTMGGLVIYRDTYPGGPAAYFSEVSHWTFVYKNYVYTAQTLIGDGVILYRCYVAWQSKLIMILPGLLWCAVGITGIGSPYIASQEKSTKILGLYLSGWIKSFYASTLITNLLTTILLAYRIWHIDKMAARVHGVRQSQLRPMLYVILDAGMIYSLALLAALMCFSTGTKGQFVMLDMLTPIISITFYMVIIRVGMTYWVNKSMNGTQFRPFTHGSLAVDQKPEVQVRVTRFIEYEASERRNSLVSNETRCREAAFVGGVDVV